MDFLYDMKFCKFIFDKGLPVFYTIININHYARFQGIVVAIHFS
jgi:hypothetical protein